MLGRRTEWSQTDGEIASLAGKARLSTQHELNRRVKEPANKLNGSRDRLGLTPATLERVVRTGLDLAHPATGVERLVTFDQDAVVGRNDLVLSHLEHRLVDLCLILLREELWSQESRLSRVTARVVESDVLKVPVLVAHGRVVVTGAEGTRWHEEVPLAGGRIEQGAFVRAKEEEIDRWMAVATERLAPEAVRERLAQM